MTHPQLPKQWANSDQLDGYDFVDKADLVGEPFRIVSIEPYVNTDGVSFVNVQAERANGIPFAFNDTSTGVRTQLLDYLSKRLGLIDGERPIEGTVYAVSLVAPRGLRVSEFGLTKDNTPVGRDDPRTVRKARTYYVTTSGVPKTAETLSELPTVIAMGTAIPDGALPSSSAPARTRKSAK